jgi:hypothetical protein
LLVIGGVNATKYHLHGGDNKGHGNEFDDVKYSSLDCYPCYRAKHVNVAGIKAGTRIDVEWHRLKIPTLSNQREGVRWTPLALHCISSSSKWEVTSTMSPATGSLSKELRYLVAAFSFPTCDSTTDVANPGFALRRYNQE